MNECHYVCLVVYKNLLNKCWFCNCVDYLTEKLNFPYLNTKLNSRWKSR